MGLTDKEKESMDDYFKRKGLSRLWENLKLFVEDSKGGDDNTSGGNQVTRVELYPNKEDFRYVFGNTNVNSNAYLIDSSIFNEDREIAITDTINDDLEETFTEVYPCV